MPGVKYIDAGTVSCQKAATASRKSNDGNMTVPIRNADYHRECEKERKK